MVGEKEAEGGSIFECWNIDYCNAKPTKAMTLDGAADDAAQYGWVLSAFTMSGLTAYST